MATLHALHGLPGSGKTLLARRLALALPAVRFSPDEWMIALHGMNPSREIFRLEQAKIMTLIWEHASRVLSTGTDVVLDAGFWTRSSRDDARERASTLGVKLKFYALVCPAHVARERTLRRTEERRGDCLIIDGEAFDAFCAEFEPILPEERPLVVVDPTANLAGP
jgi:predicted kinase